MGSSTAAIVLAVVLKVGLETGEGFRMAASRQKWLKMVLSLTKIVKMNLK